MKVDIVFIILHYKDVELTKRAVDSLLKLDGIENAKIIIVENGSNNGSDQLLNREYIDFPLIDVVVSQENRGFSRGNNLGYAFAKERYNADFFAIINNDVIISDIAFIQRLKQLYKEQPFFVCGPDVYIPQTKYHSSPLRRAEITDIQLEEEINNNRKILMECEKKHSRFVQKKYCKEIVLHENQFYLFLVSLKRLLLGERKKDWATDQSGFAVLQGSCLILSRDFIQNADKAFEPETFLYGEEYILSERCKRNRWNMEYFHNLQVLHTCQGSLKSEKPTLDEFKKKMSFSAKTSIESLETFRDYRQRE